MPRDGAYTLGDCTKPTLELVCRKCERSGRFNVGRLIAEYGADKKLPELRHVLAKCPRTLPNHRSVNESDPCGVEYVTRAGTAISDDR
jgi:hypothetical protein